jgi:hypothetical protein
LIPVSAELVTTVDEYLLTLYPLLERSPVGADDLCYGVWEMGDRVIGLEPERCLSYRGQGPHRVPLSGPSNRRSPGSRMTTRLKATSGFEPLYEALQASA